MSFGSAVPATKEIARDAAAAVGVDFPICDWDDPSHRCKDRTSRVDDTAEVAAYLVRMPHPSARTVVYPSWIDAGVAVRALPVAAAIDGGYH